MSRIGDKDYSDTLELIVEAALDPAAWIKVLHQLARLTDCVAGGITVENPHSKSGAPLVYFGFDKNHVEKTFDHYLPMNPLFGIAPRLTAGAIIANGDVIATRDFVKTEFYDGWARPQGLCSPLTLVLDRGPEDYCPLTLVRPDGRGEASDLDRKFLQLLAPHLKRALRAHRQIESAKAMVIAGNGLLDQIPVAVFFLDRQGRVLQANAAGETLLNSDRGLTSKNNQLRSSDPQANRALQAAVLEVTAGRRGAGAEIVLPRLGRSSLVATILAVTPETASRLVDSTRVCCTVLISEPEAKQATNTSAIARMFSLTPSEAKLLSLLAAGESTTEAAAKLNITQNTLRTHLKRIFAKTGTSRQVELIQLTMKAGFFRRHASTVRDV